MAAASRSTWPTSAPVAEEAVEVTRAAEEEAEATVAEEATNRVEADTKAVEVTKVEEATRAEEATRVEAVATAAVGTNRVKSSCHLLLLNITLITLFTGYGQQQGGGGGWGGT
jgi:hypothetical protein